MIAQFRRTGFAVWRQRARIGVNDHRFQVVGELLTVRNASAGGTRRAAIVRKRLREIILKVLRIGRVTTPADNGGVRRKVVKKSRTYIRAFAQGVPDCDFLDWK